MELRDILRRRRMVRSYRPEPIPRETVERIVSSVRRAPSAGFSQGIRLRVVTDESIRRSIAELTHEDEAVAAGREPWLSVAPVHVVVGVREEDYHERYRRPDKLKLTADGTEIEWPVPYWFVDAGAGLMLVLLAAIDEGLAAGLTGVPVEIMQPFKELLGIPEEVAVVGVVTIGHAAPDPTWSAASSVFKERRKPLDEVVRWERWS
jgi:FMN reductase [NAD(P)H]